MGFARFARFAWFAWFARELEDCSYLCCRLIFICIYGGFTEQVIYVLILIARGDGGSGGTLCSASTMAVTVSTVSWSSKIW